MDPEKIDGLFSMTQSAGDDHLGYALDLLYECRLTRPESGAPPGMSHRRVATSCIIHGFSSLESAVSRLSYEMFTDVESRRYVPEEQRGFALQKLLAAWARMPVIDKLEILLQRGGGERPSAKLLARLREVNNLRNWLVHGFAYKRTLLLEPSAKETTTYDVLDFEDSVDWSTKFPNTKFHGLPELQYDDARTAIAVVIEALGLLAGAFGEIFFATITRPELRTKLLSLDAVKDLNAIDEWVERYWDA